MKINQLSLSETSFDTFYEWCKTNKTSWYPYMTAARLHIIYDYYVKHNMTCKGNKCTVTIDGKWESAYSEPLDHSPTREDFEWNLFHEVWCKTEWATRCSRSETELGYDSVKSEFGMAIIKALKEAM